MRHDFTSEEDDAAEQTHETENLERRPNENEAQEKERGQDNADRKARELEEIQKYITRQKEAARLSFPYLALGTS
jgi:hypothetical protein